jgi:hypothetical protein
MTSSSRTKKLNPKIQQLADHYGVELSWRSEGDNYSYDGKTVALLDWQGKPRTEANVIHDIAHWVMASPTRRSYPEFGLGPSPDTGTLRVATRVSDSYSTDEECRSSILGVYWQWRYGIGDWKDTLEHHNWLDGTSVYEVDNYGSYFDDYFDGAMEDGEIGKPYLDVLLKNGHLDLIEEIS